jgi:hypothetical protein
MSDSKGKRVSEEEPAENAPVSISLFILVCHGCCCLLFFFFVPKAFTPSTVQKCNATKEELFAAGKNVLEDCPVCRDRHHVRVAIGDHRSSGL